MELPIRNVCVLDRRVGFCVMLPISFSPYTTFPFSNMCSPRLCNFETLCIPFCRGLDLFNPPLIHPP